MLCYPNRVRTATDVLLVCWQLTASRSLPSSLTSLTSSTISAGDVMLSPTTQFSSPSVDVVKTVWGTNPFGSLATNDTATTGVFELTVRDSVSGADVVLNDTVDPTTSRQLPVHFWMAVGSSGSGGTLYDCGEYH